MHDPPTLSTQPSLPTRMAALGRPLPAYHELEYHPFVSDEQRQLVGYSRARGLRLIGYNSLGGAKGPSALGRQPHVAAMATRRGMSVAGLLLRYSMDSGVAVIPMASSPEHIAANLATGRQAPALASGARGSSEDVGGQAGPAGGGGSTSTCLSASEIAQLEGTPRPSEWASFEAVNDPFSADGLGCESAEALIGRTRKALDSLRQEGGATRVLDVHDWPVRGLCPELLLTPSGEGASGGAGGAIRSAHSRSSHGSASAAAELQQLAAATRLGAAVQRSSQPFVILPRYLGASVASRFALRALTTHWNAIYPPGTRCRAATCECSKLSRDGVSRDGKLGDMRCHNCGQPATITFPSQRPLSKTPLNDTNRSASGYGVAATAVTSAYRGGHPPCQSLGHDRLLLALARGFFQAHGHPGFEPSVNRVVGNMVKGDGSNSGGSWHQDEEIPEQQMLPEPGAQIKCMLYVDSVTSRGGPFTMLIDYDRAELARRQVKSKLPLGPRGGLPGRLHRFHDADIAQVTGRDGAADGGGSNGRVPSQRVGHEGAHRRAFALELHAPAGTVICFDAGNIHHGKPLEGSGARHAATVYFHPPKPRQNSTHYLTSLTGLDLREVFKRPGVEA
jgi:hypothetical protein